MTTCTDCFECLANLGRPGNGTVDPVHLSSDLVSARSPITLCHFPVELPHFRTAHDPHTTSSKTHSTRIRVRRGAHSPRQQQQHSIGRAVRKQRSPTRDPCFVGEQEICQSVDGLGPSYSHARTLCGAEHRPSAISDRAAHYDGVRHPRGAQLSGICAGSQSVNFASVMIRTIVQMPPDLIVHTKTTHRRGLSWA